jgi:hypothetical protein
MGVGLGRTRDGPRVGYIHSSHSYSIFLIQSQLGDKWAYSFDVVHDIPGLIEKRGGNASFVRSLDIHFDGGHNDHSNEVYSSLMLLMPSSIDTLFRSKAIAPYPIPICTRRCCLQDPGTCP